jgi:hypothetical protein
MAQSASAPVGYDAPQAAAPSSAPVATPPVQATASPTVVAANAAPTASPVSTPRKSPAFCDRSDTYGGHGNESHWGIRSFWELRADGS